MADSETQAVDQGASKGAENSGEAGAAAIDFGNSAFVIPGQASEAAPEEGQDIEVASVETGKTDLESPTITDDLMKDRITGLSVQEQSGYESNSYLIDLTDCEEGITYESSQALKALLSETGTVGIYINTRTSVFLIGHADSYTTYSLLDRLIKPLFGDGVKLFYNENGAFKQVKSVKLTTVRLGL